MWINRFAFLLIGTLVAFILEPANAAGDGSYQRAAGIEVYIGVVPAEITKGHEPTQPKGPMHGGVPEGIYRFHLVAAVFDANTGERITDAAVTAQVVRQGQASPKTTLEPMTIAGTITYGGYIGLAGPGSYTIGLAIKRPGMREGVSLRFPYELSR